ncbi:MAG TPA: hypothetical protein VK943_02835, partial [Arenibaculum sp.]|nr:hypothetical protein [Arenibaculum sp.]
MAQTTQSIRPLRTPWKGPFPQVAIHTTVDIRDAHPAYADAKSGNADAATALVEALFLPAAVSRIGSVVAGRNPMIVPASAIERQGFNAIPDAMALALADILSLSVDTNSINQINIVSHTRATGWHRLAHPAVFDGPVEIGRCYFIVDDHIGLGGTIASLKGHIETHGGVAIGATCLTESTNSRDIALTSGTLNGLRG